MKNIRFLSNLTKFKSPKKHKINIPNINSIYENNQKNVDINDLNYSDNFWKHSEKFEKKSSKKNITLVLVQKYYNK